MRRLRHVYKSIVYVYRVSVQQQIVFAQPLDLTWPTCPLFI